MTAVEVFSASWIDHHRQRTSARVDDCSSTTEQQRESAIQIFLQPARLQGRRARIAALKRQ